MAKELTQKQRKFAEAFVDLGCKTTAYKAAYNAAKMKDETIWVKASNLSTNPKVAAYIQEINDAAKAKAIATREEALMILSQQMRGTVGQIIDDDGNVDIQAVKQAGAAIKSLESRTTATEQGEYTSHKVTVADQRAAIETMAKLENWNKDKEVSGENITLNFNLGPGVPST